MSLLQDNPPPSEHRFLRRSVSSVVVLVYARFVLSYGLRVFRVDHQGGDTTELLVVLTRLRSICPGNRVSGSV